MTASRWRKPAAVTLLALAGALVPALVPAVASAAPASQPHWSIVKTFPTGSTIYSVAGVTSHDAWLAGQSSTGGLLVQQWNGSKWTGVATPALNSVYNAVIAGHSGTTWAFADVGVNTQYSVALRRTAHGWKPYKLANWSTINAAAVFGPKDAWAFGQLFENASGPYVRHFNGSRWLGVATPVLANDASAVAANDIWIVGQTAKSLKTVKQVFAAAQWTRGAFHLRSFPRLRLPTGAGVFDPHVVALGPSNVWVDFGLQKGMGAYPGAVLLHYNGSKWRQVSVPYRDTFMLANLAPDGRGGIWIAATANDGLLQYIYRLQAGHWSRTLMPSAQGDGTQIATIALRPGTTSAWAAGDMVPNGGGVTTGVLLQYGG